MENNPKNIEAVETVFSTRKATEADTEFARKTHHKALHDVVVRQFGEGEWDEDEQDNFFAHSWSPETFEIIQSNGEDAGYCGISRHPDYISVDELIIAPEFQGKRIGSRILQEVINEARSKGVVVRLQVLKENKAQDLYRTLGFQDVGTTETHIQMELNPASAK
jgi:ribosomal protein S18 acetylase RimI-like enzyme